jgi:glycosyltransferase involved in cell wall biosynthesis
MPQALDHRLQYTPWLLEPIGPPQGTTVTLTNSWNGFAFRGRSHRLVVVEHLFLFDAALQEFKSPAQRLFHEVLVRHWENRSFRVADAIVAVSHYTAATMRAVLPFDGIHVIHNGIDLELFSPPTHRRAPRTNEPVRLLFVGNPTRRKGYDLLPRIMQELGPGYALSYTSGREPDALPPHPGMHCLGCLNREQVRNAYCNADLVVFPSRLEGFGYAPVEAMACGTPAVVTRGSSLVELVDDGITGRLCDPEEPAAFAAAIRALSADRENLLQMGEAARRHVERQFSLRQMTRSYLELFEALEERPVRRSSNTRSPTSSPSLRASSGMATPPDVAAATDGH